ncbi:MAG: glycosyltransferase [Thermomonas sp.]|uniref:glycosyltransferase family 2 protein n=1 Tax=Thermomonas sp. TaxID=1971895 RepID=UPI001EC95D31|nr:glycosyltransferase family 2 protein [Thermomonas sp.]MBV2208553.1 glycosyltransferase [Thermomonas sp.]
MANAPWLSVLIPVYNVSAYIEDCVRSVLQQVLHDPGIEIVLLDDVGSDDSWAKVQALAAQHPQRLRLLQHAHNRGLAAARNTLLAEAQGRYIWFLDSDDILLPGSIDGLRAAVSSDDPDLVLCDFAIVREQPRLSHRLRGEQHRRTHPSRSEALSYDRNALAVGLLGHRQLHAWSKIAKRSVWQAAPFPEGRYFEDIPTIPGLLAASQSWRHIAAPWVGYRQRGDSILATTTPKKSRDLLAALHDLSSGLRMMANRFNAETQMAADYFCLRTFANLARSTPHSDAALDAECRTAMAAIFPQGIAPVLADCRRRGWWLRALRLRSALVKRGWLQ